MRFLPPLFSILNNLHRIYTTQLPHKPNRHLPNSQPFQTAKPLAFQILFWQTLHTIHFHFCLGWCKTGATSRHQSLKIHPHVSLPTHQHANKPLVNLPTSHLQPAYLLTCKPLILLWSNTIVFGKCLLDQCKTCVAWHPQTLTQR